MASHGSKPNVTGRNSGKWTARQKIIFGPPKDEPWTWLTTSLLASPAWRMRSVNVVRLIDFLIIEHRNHAGTENGDLKATYDQLVAHGLTRSEIKPAILEAVFLGLVAVTYEGGRYAGNNQPSAYRLTFYANSEGHPATNQWKGKTAEAVREWKRDIASQKAKKARHKKQFRSATSRTAYISCLRAPVPHHHEISLVLTSNFGEKFWRVFFRSGTA